MCKPWFHISLEGEEILKIKPALDVISVDVDKDRPNTFRIVFKLRKKGEENA